MLDGMAKRTTLGAILAGNVAAARVRRRLQQQDLADRMRALGWKWVRQTVGEVENNRRRLSAEEIYGLAEALEVSIPVLMTPSDPDGFVVFPNGKYIHNISLERLAGRGVNDHAVQWQDDGTPMFAAYLGRPVDDPFGPEMRPAMAAQGWPEEPEPAKQPVPVVAAIVVSDRGVLIERRHDGQPLWTFPAGEQDAVKDENPADTAIREVKEETGLRVYVVEEIGRPGAPEDPTGHDLPVRDAHARHRLHRRRS